MVGVTWENQRKADITAGDLQGDIIVVAQASAILNFWLFQAFRFSYFHGEYYKSD